METSHLLLSDIASSSPVVPDKLGHSTVLTAPDARVIVLSFPAGHIMKEHSSPRPLHAQVLDGEILFTIGDDAMRLRPGDLLRVEASVRHEVEGVTDARLMLTLIG